MLEPILEVVSNPSAVLIPKLSVRNAQRSSYGRAIVEPVPARVSDLLNTLRHPIRLPLLLVLEELGEASATQLSEALDAPFDKVNYALKSLAQENVVEFVRTEPGSPGSNTYRRIYRPRLIGWSRLLAMLDEFAAGLDGGRGRAT